MASEEHLNDYCLQPNFKHEDSYDFLMVLNRYFLEHGFELSEKLLKEKIRELTESTLTIYNKHVGNSRIYERAGKRVYKPFNELEAEISVPREGYGRIAEHEMGRHASYQQTTQVGVLGNISINAVVKRKVFDYEQQLCLYIVPDVPESLKSIDVSLFQPFKRYEKKIFQLKFFFTRQNIR